MAQCNRLNAINLGDGYSLLLFQEQMMTPTPHARSFELPGDPVQYAPDRPADVQHVKLDIALDFAEETISGTIYTTFSTLYDALNTISFDAYELHVEKVALADGKELAFHTTDKKLIVTLDRPYRYGEQFTTAVTYHAKPRIGLHFVKPAPEDPTRPVQAFTFGQPRYHSYWFPCFDSPNDRATTEILATVPAQFLTVSNGNLLEVIDNGATKTHHWLHNVPHATYLISLVVSDFAVIEDNYKGKPVNYYVRKDRKDDAPLYMGKTPQMMKFFSEFTGVEYPYDKYAQTVVEIYTGAMEHTTATTHSFALLLDKRAAIDMDLVPVVAHELAHQWFGDLLTCRDWSNGWLNEGFATYFEHLWGEHDLGADYFKQSMLDLKDGYLAEDRQYRRPVVYHVYHNQGFELFDRHLYHKGGWVLHMLRHQLGEASFRRGIKAYIERNRFREVITADLERALEEATGRSLAGFFQQWIYSGGYPEFEVSYSWDSEQKLAKVKIKQTQKVDELTPCFVTPVDLAFTIPVSDAAAKDAKTAETRVVPLRVVVGEDGQVEQTFFQPLEREPLMVRFDPDGWLLKTLKFERSAHMLRYQLAHDPDVLGRIEAAQGLAARDDAESFAALETALNSDSFWGVRAAVANALSTKGSDAAQTALLNALQTLDPETFSQARIAVVNALGKFQAPQQSEQAQRSAQALTALLEQGDISYRVEAATAEALGHTHTPGVVETLEKQLARPSWMYTSQRGILAGLAQTGEDRALELIENYMTNASSYPTLRRHAANALVVAAHLSYLYSEAARQQAVTSLLYAVEHDVWGPVRGSAARALLAFNERRAIPTLERVASQELDDGVQRVVRLAVHGLRNNDKGDDQLKQLRKDLDEVREENRKLREQVSSLDARIK
ncbi:MAG TPA: M1 family aminopeptidase [Ktedonobacteraceae bacterium]|nr:M1 family aminopeptidase [Ktedonobacteraceae bacterium]